MDVRALRRQLNLTQEELAEKVPTHSRTIRRWERKEVKPNLLGRARLRAIMQEWQQRQARSDGPSKRQLEASQLDVETDDVG